VKVYGVLRRKFSRSVPLVIITDRGLSRALSGNQSYCDLYRMTCRLMVSLKRSLYSLYST